MGIWEWFLGLFKKESGLVRLDENIDNIKAEVLYKKLAVDASINLIANAVARSEFITYEQGKEKRGENYYLFNVEPNPNKTSSKFWREAIHQLVYNNECLIIQQNDYFYVADSFVKKPYAFRDNLYDQVEVSGLSLREKFRERDVFHLELHKQEIRKVIDGMYVSYGKLIEASMKHYKANNSRRGILKIPTSYPETEKAQKELESLLNEKMRRFFNAEGGAALPLSNGMEYDELTSNIGVKGTAEGREVRSFVDDIFDFVAVAFQIPPQLLRGNVADTDKAVNNFLTFCINPIAELVEDEVNRKLYGKANYLNRTYMKMDTTRIKSVDITDIASSLDILTRIGANTLNDNLRILGREEIDEAWANERYITKNYEKINDNAEGR
ncbi:phage portal protein [Tindallia californiensis]|uniref:Phage portal protein, HK97 family n=1 Tax=Tindallia californiensis TaxID=159292 RepID=A0A1H3R0S8_9FIRM|nr:phage portal protein [Tindallia californiensis]SDZ19186.1 phage portal protein, HK97 family [Tindallia californiensis]